MGSWKCLSSNTLEKADVTVAGDALQFLATLATRFGYKYQPPYFETLPFFVSIPSFANVFFNGLDILGAATLSLSSGIRYFLFGTSGLIDP